MIAAEMVKALGGKNGNCRCPAHDDKTPSLSITDGPDGQLLTHCFAGCSPEAVWQALKDCGSVGKSADVCGYRVAANGRMSRHSEPDRRAEALAFWEASRPALHTPAQDYLACRGIVIQPPACIRYHGAENALVAAIQAHDGTLTGVQRIYLATDSRGTWKSGRYSLGPIKGGACRLTPGADRLQLCESIEDGLALLQMTGKPTWAVPGAGFMESFELPLEVRELVLAPDHDKAGLEAIAKTAAKLANSLVKVKRLLPPKGMDWCEGLGDFEERAAIRAFNGSQDRDAAEHRSWVEIFCDGS